MNSAFRTVFIFAAISIASLFSVNELRISLADQSKSNVLTVFFSINDSTPENTEYEATSLLENAFSQIPNVKRISSRSTYDGGQIDLSFEESENMDEKYFEVSSIIRQYKSKLPTSVSYPNVIFKNNQKSAAYKEPLMVYDLFARDASNMIKKNAEEILVESLVTIPGIKNLSVNGARGLQVSLIFDKDKLKQFGLTLEQLKQELVSRNLSTHMGVGKNDDGSIYSVNIDQSNPKIEDLQSLTFYNTGREIRLADIAKICIEEEAVTSYFRINGKNSVSLIVEAQNDINSIELADKVRSVMSARKAALPKDYVLSLNYDSTEYLKREITKNQHRIFTVVVILLLFVFISYADWRHTLIILSTLVVNLSLSILLIWILKITVTLYTISGMAIAFGLIVDHAIIMLDYYHQFKSRMVVTALLGATLSTIAALLLVYLLPDQEQHQLSSVVYSIVVVLVVSLLTNLFFTVAMYQLLFKNVKSAKYLSIKKLRRMQLATRRYLVFIQALAKYRKTFVLAIIFLFGTPLFLLPNEIEGQQFYNSAINSTEYQRVRPFLDKWTGGIWRLFKENVYANSQFRTSEQTELFIKGNLPVGSTPEQMNSVIENVENFISAEPGVKKYISSVNSGQSATVEVIFNDNVDSALPYRIKDELQTRLLNLGGVTWSVYGVGKGFSNLGAENVPTFSIKVTGYNYEKLAMLANRFAERLNANSRIQKVDVDASIKQNDRPSNEYYLDLDYYKLSYRNSSAGTLFAALEMETPPQAFSQYITVDNIVYPLWIKEQKSTDFSSWDLLNRNIEVSTGKNLKLKDISRISLHSTLNNIYREDRQYIRMIGMEYLGTYKFGKSYLEAQIMDMKSEMPLGFDLKLYTNEDDSSGKELNQYWLLLVLLLANFIIGVLLFESVRYAFYIILIIPVSFIGLFLTFYLFDLPFDQGGYASFILLGGLVVNAGIFVINDFNLYSRKSVRTNKALIKAISNRGRTILLMTTSTIFGLIPFLIDGKEEAFWFPLAAGTIGGLVFSIFTIFIFLPVILFKNEKNQMAKV